MWTELPATVSLIMTREVVSVEESDSLANLLASMQALRFRHLPVTDDDRLIGLLTERDLLRISTSNLLPHSTEQDRELFGRFHVRDVMVRDVITVTPETPVATAGQLLLDKRVGCLPVVDSNNELVGILTSSDFVASVVRSSKTL
jgi:CBS domain-containing membrane protein